MPGVRPDPSCGTCLAASAHRGTCLAFHGSAREIAAQLRPVLLGSLLAPFRKASTPNAFLLEHTIFRVLDAIILAALLQIGQLRCYVEHLPPPCCSHALTRGKGSVAQGHPDPHHPRRPRIEQTSVWGLCCCWKLRPCFSCPCEMTKDWKCWAGWHWKSPPAPVALLPCPPADCRELVEWVWRARAPTANLRHARAKTGGSLVEPLWRKLSQRWPWRGTFCVPAVSHRTPKPLNP